MRRRVGASVWLATASLSLTFMTIGLLIAVRPGDESLVSSLVAPVKDNIPSIEMRERNDGPGYHYRIVYGGTDFFVLGSSKSALEVYWHAATLTLDRMKWDK